MNYDDSSSPIRVLHVIESLGTGGMENGVVNLVNCHNPDRVIADVLCLRSEGEFAARIPQHQLHFDPAVGASILQATKAVAAHCRRGEYHLIHAHSWATLMPAFLGAKLAGNTKFVHGEHGTLYLDNRKRRFIQKMLFNRSDRCLSVSDSLRSEITSILGLEPDRFYVIRNGVDIERFADRDSARANMCASLGLDNDVCVIGSIGRLVGVKDYPTLLHAYALLRQEAGSNTHLVFVGDGPERARLQALAEALEIETHATFLGRRDDVPALLPGFDVFVLPSVHEGMSNTLIEAAASAVPAVASDIAANREVVANAETGYLFPVGDSESLYKILKTLTDDRSLRGKISDNALALAQTEFSLSGMVNNYERIYTELIYPA